MQTDQERTGVNLDGAVEEAQRILGLRPAENVSRRAAGAERSFLLFTAMMALCFVIVAMLFGGLALGTLLGVPVIVSAAAALWFTHARLMGGHRH